MSDVSDTQSNNSQDTLEIKIFPRNLTAYADHIVRGNPPITRPESGVDNCFPGLEIDQRNLDKAFFPGLIFEFHHTEVGAKLLGVKEDSMPFEKGLRQSDLSQPGGLYLWALIGRTTLDPTENIIKEFFGFSGIGILAWRLVHDLLPGRIAILIAQDSPVGAEPIDGAFVSSFIKNEFKPLYDSGGSIIQRNQEGQIEIAAFVDERAGYLDDYGVIDIDSYEPGDLTRSLCSPWQFDFRDCACYYWASSKPDLVANSDGSNTHLNFLRKDRSEEPSDLDLTQPINWNVRKELRHDDLINGAWNNLPVVINGKESELSRTSSSIIKNGDTHDEDNN